MTFDQFKTLIRALVPGAGVKVDETLMGILINKGVDDVNIRAAALQSNKKFNVTTERFRSISTYISDFAGFSEGGLWWNAGSASSPDWRKLDPYTEQSLDDQFPQWKNESSDSPLRYVQSGNQLQIDPVPNTALSEGLWAFYIVKPPNMTAGGHYPFSGSTTEITALTVLDDAIVDYVRWKLNPMLGKDEKGVIIESDYRKSLAEKIQLLRRRLDISANPLARMRGPTIG